MTAEETLAIIDSLRAKGARKIKVGEVEVEFAERDVDPLAMLEQAHENARNELLASMSHEDREKYEKQERERLMYG